MAAEVSSLVRILNKYKDDRTVGNESAGGAKSTVALMTRDLLGVGVGGDQSQELDLDLQVPTGWEKRLDLKSGKVYLQRCNSASSSSISSTSFAHHTADQSNQTVSRFQDLNSPPTSTNPVKPLLNLFDDSNLELKLVSSSMPSLSTSSSSVSSSNLNFQSVCTLDKVKSALERVEKDPSAIKKRQSPSSSFSSMKEDENDDKFTGFSSPVAVGCPGCLSYVLVMKSNPKCPRCNSFVPLPAMKKPKIDLNISI